MTAGLPPYITPALVGKACGMTTRAARRLLGRAGVLKRIGGAWVVGEGQLRELLPEIHERVFDHVVLQAEEDQRRP